VLIRSTLWTRAPTSTGACDRVIVLAAAPLLAGLALFLFSNRLSTMLRPRLVVPLLTAVGLTVAICTALVLSAAAVLLCAQLHPLAQLGHWSAPALRHDTALPDAVEALALLLVLAGLAAVTVRAVHSFRTLASAERATKLLNPSGGALVVVEDDVPTAYSVACWHGRIVVSTSMLSALSAPERRALLAHEASHLRHRHHFYLHLAALAAAGNPLLRRTADEIARGVERWADEDAAIEVDSRRVAARSLARAALVRLHQQQQPGLAAADSHVPERVRALLGPAPVDRRSIAVLLVVVAGLCWAGAVVTAEWAHQLIVFAEAAYRGHP
jgi:Zn-dependent protease with chaperone function